MAAAVAAAAAVAVVVVAVAVAGWLSRYGWIAKSLWLWLGGDIAVAEG